MPSDSAATRLHEGQAEASSTRMYEGGVEEDGGSRRLSPASLTGIVPHESGPRSARVCSWATGPVLIGGATAA
jgi:hypothetical protein